MGRSSGRLIVSINSYSKNHVFPVKFFSPITFRSNPITTETQYVSLVVLYLWTQAVYVVYTDYGTKKTLGGSAV